MSGHDASADIGRLRRLANLVLTRQETRTVLCVANGWPVTEPVDNGSPQRSRNRKDLDLAIQVLD